MSGYNTMHSVCPLCNTHLDTPWDFFDDLDDADTEIDCPECGEPLKVTQIVEYVYLVTGR